MITRFFKKFKKLFVKKKKTSRRRKKPTPRKKSKSRTKARLTKKPRLPKTIKRKGPSKTKKTTKPKRKSVRKRKTRGTTILEKGKVRQKKSLRKKTSKTVSRRSKPYGKKSHIKKTQPTSAYAEAFPKRQLVGEITHYFSRIEVCVIKMTAGKMGVGDQLFIAKRGAKEGFYQEVKSLQIESVDVQEARRGQLVGMKVEQKVKPGYQVFRVK